MGERTRCDALSRAQRRAVGGRSDRRPSRVPRLWRASGTVGVRSPAGSATARGSQVTPATPGLLSWLWSYARAVPGLVGPRSPRRGGGDRRGAAARCVWDGASTDRGAAGSSAGNGPRVAAGGQSPGRQSARVRDPVGGLSRSRASRDHGGWQRTRRRSRGGHGRCPGVGAALRSGPGRSVGAGGVADGRVAGALSRAAVAGHVRRCGPVPGDSPPSPAAVAGSAERSTASGQTRRRSRRALRPRSGRRGAIVDERPERCGTFERLNVCASATSITTQIGAGVTIHGGAQQRQSRSNRQMTHRTAPDGAMSAERS